MPKTATTRSRPAAKNTMVGEGSSLAAGRERVVAVFGIDLQTGTAHVHHNLMVRAARSRAGHITQGVLVAGVADRLSIRALDSSAGELREDLAPSSVGILRKD